MNTIWPRQTILWGKMNSLELLIELHFVWRTSCLSVGQDNNAARFAGENLSDENPLAPLKDDYWPHIVSRNPGEIKHTLMCLFSEQHLQLNQTKAPLLPVRQQSVPKRSERGWPLLFLCCSNTHQLLREHGERWEIRRGLPGKPEAVAFAEIRHGLVPVQGGWEHDRLHLQPQQNPRAQPGEHVLPLCPLHPSVPHAPP